jgi:hypothetical protein
MLSKTEVCDESHHLLYMYENMHVYKHIFEFFSFYLLFAHNIRDIKEVLTSNLQKIFEQNYASMGTYILYTKYYFLCKYFDGILR